MCFITLYFSAFTLIQELQMWLLWPYVYWANRVLLTEHA